MSFPTYADLIALDATKIVADPADPTETIFLTGPFDTCDDLCFDCDDLPATYVTHSDLRFRANSDDLHFLCTICKIGHFGH